VSPLSVTRPRNFAPVFGCRAEPTSTALEAGPVRQDQGIGGNLSVGIFFDYARSREMQGGSPDHSAMVKGGGRSGYTRALRFGDTCPLAFLRSHDAMSFLPADVARGFRAR